MSVNKIILVGNVGRDPEVRYFDNGGAVANFTLATTERGYTAANGTQVPDHTEWHNIVLWRGLAEIAEKYVKKGSKLFIEGKIRTRSYDDATGVKRYVTEVWGSNLELLDRRMDNPQAQPISPVTAGPVSNPTPVASTPAAPFQPLVDDNGTDDLPF